MDDVSDDMRLVAVLSVVVFGDESLSVTAVSAIVTSLATLVVHSSAIGGPDVTVVS